MLASSPPPSFVYGEYLLIGGFFALLLTVALGSVFLMRVTVAVLALSAVMEIFSLPILHPILLFYIPGRPAALAVIAFAGVKWLTRHDPQEDGRTRSERSREP